MKRLSIGILAHVDAGKTTLSESLLYKSGSIKKAGRVDSKDSFFDNDDLERLRGITIFSKQAILNLRHSRVTLIDTPGHVDFSADMERTLGVLDYAILVINALDGVQSHTKTLWRLLREYQIPTFIFVNKMDNELVDRDKTVKEIHSKLSRDIVGFDVYSKAFDEDGFDISKLTDELIEELAYSDEDLLEKYEAKDLDSADVIESIYERRIYPMFFGSALHGDGVDNIIHAMDDLTKEGTYGEDLALKVYKISYDEAGTRLSHVKIFGGSLRPRTSLNDEKINQIRQYHGDKYISLEEAVAADVVALTGLRSSYAGMVVGLPGENTSPIIEPVLNYKMLVPEDADISKVYKELEYMYEEEPSLEFSKKSDGDIELKLFGQVQIEILKSRIYNKLGIEVEFTKGSVVYKETVLDEVEGIGHFEPLKHYAEVHLLIRPGKRGEGISASVDIADDMLAQNYQSAVCAHIMEKEHKGVLIGAKLTDVEIVLAAGKADNRHTDGGDFREATYRAIRQGLMKAESVILEPYYNFVINCPKDNVGRVLTDLSNLYAKFSAPEIEDDTASISGFAPVVLINNYQMELRAFTAGEGSISLSYRNYDRCHNEEEVIEEYGYDPELDEENPCGSIFCSHGSGFYVPWDMVEDHMHVASVYTEDKSDAYDSTPVHRSTFDEHRASNEELIEIFERTYGKIKSPVESNNINKPKDVGRKEKEYVYKPKEKEETYILIDAYNVIFSWKELSDIAETDIQAARDRLVEIISHYRSSVDMQIIVVFDAYKVENHKREVIKYQGISIVYTKQAETADQYIEKTVSDMAKKYRVIVVTSDATEQIIIQSKGCILISSREFELEVKNAEKEISEKLSNISSKEKSYISDYMKDI